MPSLRDRAMLGVMRHWLSSVLPHAPCKTQRLCRAEGRGRSQLLVIAPSLLPEFILTDIIRLASPASHNAINSHACDKEVTLQVQG